MLQSSEGLPQMIAKAVVEVDRARKGRDFIATPESGPDALLAEGVIPELSGSAFD